MTTENIINASEADFEYEVLAYSQNTPVVVDFWASWCRPCKVLSPMLERLTIEAHGTFRLARVDVDQNPNLALRYGVRTLPTVKVFTDGQVTGEFVGVQPENRLREILGNITPPSPASLAVEKADSLLASQRWVDAEKMYRQILQQVPDQSASLLGLAKSLVGQNRGAEALDILRHFPPSRLVFPGSNCTAAGRSPGRLPARRASNRRRFGCHLCQHHSIGWARQLACCHRWTARDPAPESPIPQWAGTAGGTGGLGAAGRRRPAYPAVSFGTGVYSVLGCEKYRVIGSGRKYYSKYSINL
jgi:thioredoxin